MISTSTVRQPSDSLTVDLSSVFNLAQSGCHLTYYNSQSTTTHTQLFCLRRVSLDNKLHIHFTSETDRETGRLFFSLFFLLSLFVNHSSPGTTGFLPVQLKLPASPFHVRIIRLNLGIKKKKKKNTL